MTAHQTAHNTPRTRAGRIVPTTLAGALVAALALGVLALGVVLLTPEPVVAQVPATEEQAQAVEQQLLCPICTNERLDVCGLAICNDMKRIIRDRLADGASPDDIILFFEGRYGPKVRAQLPVAGFNLWLYGWIGGSTLAVAGAGAWFLFSLRRRARPATVEPTPDVSMADDDAWLDAQIAPDTPDEPAGDQARDQARDQAGDQPGPSDEGRDA